jgi:hypothetical protein
MAKGFQDLEAQAEARALDHGDWLAILLDHETDLAPVWWTPMIGFRAKERSVRWR